MTTKSRISTLILVLGAIVACDRSSPSAQPADPKAAEKQADAAQKQSDNVAAYNSILYLHRGLSAKIHELGAPSSRWCRETFVLLANYLWLYEHLNEGARIIGQKTPPNEPSFIIKLNGADKFMSLDDLRAYATQVFEEWTPDLEKKCTTKLVGSAAYQKLVAQDIFYRTEYH